MNPKIGKDVFPSRIRTHTTTETDKTRQNQRIKIWKTFQFTISANDIQRKINLLNKNLDILVRIGRYGEKITKPKPLTRITLGILLKKIKQKKLKSPNVKLSQRELKVLDSVFQL